MIRFRFVPVILVAALALGGCEMLYSMGGGAASMLGAGVSESIEAKKAAIALWKIERARLMAKVTDRWEMEAEKKFAADDYTAGLAILREIIAFHDENQPLWLHQNFIRKDNGQARPAP